MKDLTIEKLFNIMAWKVCPNCPFNITTKSDCSFYIKKGCGVANKVIKYIVRNY